MHDTRLLLCCPSLWSGVFFSCRFCVRLSLFEFILERICAFDSYFVRKVDATILLGFLPHQKMAFVVCMLCYGLVGDVSNECYRTSESTALKCLKRFCLAIWALFEMHHMCQPNKVDFKSTN